MKFVILALVLMLGGAFFLSQQKPAQVPNFTISPMPLPSSGQAIDSKNMLTQLKIEDIKVGTGAEVKSGDIVVVNYKGTLLDGTQFDSSYDPGRQPFETKIGVGMVIKGWDIGLLGMKVGGKRKLTIPSDLAYGPQGAGSTIPPNSPLIFELELLAIK